VLARMIKIHNLNRAGKFSIGDVPDPYRAIGKNDFLGGSGPAALPSLAVHAAAELISSFDGSGVGSGSVITHWPALRIGGGLREHAAQFHFARVRRLIGVFTAAAFCLGCRDRHARTIHFDIEHWNVASSHIGKVELYSALDFSLLVALDVAADGFGMAFDGLARHLEAGEQLQLLAALVKRSVAAHHRHHAPHPGRVLGIQDVEFPVTRALSAMAGVAAIVSAFEPHRPGSRQQVAATLFAVACALPAWARHPSRHRSGFLEQMIENAGACPVHGGASSLDGFQIKPAASA
jgi:hypothetical protein